MLELTDSPQIKNAIDLGLPSGTKWASFNIGANSPEQYGDFFSWGETEKKDYYDWCTYCHCEGTESTCRNIGNICTTLYDVAYMKWGNNWAIPSPEQINELIDFTTYKWIEINGTFGGEFVGSNGKSIFLPAAGGRHGSVLYTSGIHGIYWSGMQNKNNNDAYALHFDNCFADWCKNNWYRKVGFPIRPVLCIGTQ